MWKKDLESFNNVNVNNSFLPFPNAEQKNSEMNLASWRRSYWLTFEEAYVLFNIIKSPWQRTDYETMAEATRASELTLNLCLY